MINSLLSRSAELESELLQFISLPPYDRSERIVSSRVMCSIAFEHAESAKLLIATGNFTSATGLVRLQYEALTRAMWLLYSASDHAISKLMCELTNESAEKANDYRNQERTVIHSHGSAPVLRSAVRYCTFCTMPRIRWKQKSLLYQPILVTKRSRHRNEWQNI